MIWKRNLLWSGIFQNLNLKYVARSTVHRPTLFKDTEFELVDVFVSYTDEEGNYPSDNSYDAHQHPSHELHVHVGLWCSQEHIISERVYMDTLHQNHKIIAIRSMTYMHEMHAHSNSYQLCAGSGSHSKCKLMKQLILWSKLFVNTWGDSSGWL